MNKLTGIFLDDERSPSEVTWLNYPNIDWAIVRSVDEFKKLLNTMFFSFDKFKLDAVSFDNDLGLNQPEGKAAARFLCGMCAEFDIALPICFIHTQNPESADYILSLLNSYNKIYSQNNKFKHE